MQQNETTLKRYSVIHAPTPPDSSAANKLSGVGAFFIPLTQGKVAIVDEEDFKELSRYKWYAMKDPRTWYAYRVEVRDRKHRMILMHRMILKPAKSLEIDHRDGDGLNNRRTNLRIATKAQNHFNQKKRKGTSKYKGVSWNLRCRKWFVQIKLNGKSIYLGRFEDELQAAKAYDAAASKYFGEFACLNF